MKLIGKWCQAYLRPELHRGRGGYYGGVIKKVVRLKSGAIKTVTVDMPAFGRVRLVPEEVNNKQTGTVCGVMFRGKLVPLE